MKPGPVQPTLFVGDYIRARIAQVQETDNRRRPRWTLRDVSAILALCREVQRLNTELATARQPKPETRRTRWTSAGGPAPCGWCGRPVHNWRIEGEAHSFGACIGRVPDERERHIQDQLRASGLR